MRRVIAGKQEGSRGVQRTGVAGEARPVHSSVRAGATHTPGPGATPFTCVGTAGDERGSLRSEDPTVLGHEFPTRVVKSGYCSELERSDPSRGERHYRDASSAAPLRPAGHPRLLRISLAQSPTGSCRLRGGGREREAAWLGAPRPVQCPARRPPGEAPPTAPSGARGPREAEAGDPPRRPQQSGGRPALASAGILRLREVKKLVQGHIASKRPAGPGLRTHLARSPPHTARPAAAAETAAQCAGASRAGRAGRRRGRQPAGRRTKPPFFPRAPPSAPSPTLAAPAGGSARSRDPPPSFSAPVPGGSGQSEDKRSRTRFRGREPRTCGGEGRRGGEGATEGAVATPGGEGERPRDFPLVTRRRTDSNFVAQRMEG
ncbi:basic proline-rich protein-like [Onychomys torridus]|uniref:basic proline-rich protein-like n=1 Tax=Onychomys torridus TaxID=38674 RepID=UPI00167F8934|nr:basic proline-rich protein-like [Onychomys torridus]